MQRSCYEIEQQESQWIVSVCGTRVLTCKTKRTALKAARRALVLLHQSQHQSQQVEALGPPPSHLYDDDLRRAGTLLQPDRHDRRDAPAKVAGTRRG